MCRPIGKDEVDGVVEEVVFSLVSCGGKGEGGRQSGFLMEECTTANQCVCVRERKSLMRHFV